MRTPIDILVSPTKTIEKELKEKNEKKAHRNLINLLFSVAFVIAAWIPAFFARVPPPIFLPIFFGLAFGMAVALFLFFSHAIAKALGGKRSVAKVANVLSSILLSFAIFFLLFSFAHLRFLLILLSLYVLYIFVLAVEKCYRFDVWRATATVLSSGILAFLLTMATAVFAFGEMIIEFSEWQTRAVLSEFVPEMNYTISAGKLMIKVSNEGNESLNLSIVGEVINLNENIAPRTEKDFSFDVKCKLFFSDYLLITRNGISARIPIFAKCKNENIEG